MFLCFRRVAADRHQSCTVLMIQAEAPTLGLDPVVEFGKLAVIAVDGEAGNDPDDLAKEVHDRTDVVEHGAQRLMSQIHHDEADCFGGCHRSLRAP